MTVTLDIQSLGLRPAYGGYVTISVPSGLGTLSTPATQFFSSPLDPSGTDTLTWQIDVTGVGDHTLDFIAGFEGLPGTTYTDTFHASVHAFGTFDVTTIFNPSDTVALGTPITVSLTVFDDLSVAVTDATINATIDSTTVTFSHSGSGIYEGTIDTAPLTPATYSLDISIQKNNFNTYTGSHTITVQAAPFIPGFPPFAIAVGTVIAVGIGLISHRRKLNKV
jgi:hypothetical protein